MTSKIDNIKDKLRKILAIVRSNGNEHERDMAMMRLQEMLVKHRLEMSDIEEKEKEGIVKLEIVGINGPWARTVCQAIAKLNFCDYVFRRQYGNDQRLITHIFIGRPHEAEVAQELAMLILEQLNTESRVQARRTSDPSFQRSFLNAASHTIYHRAEALIKQASAATQAQSQSTALMVLNAYALAEQENKQYLTTAFKNLKSGTNRQTSKSHAGYNEGKVFGDKIPLSVTKKLA
jgi:hypothetical protein